MNFEGPEGGLLRVEFTVHRVMGWIHQNYVLLVPLKMTLFGNWVFVDIIGLNEVTG